MALSLPHGPGPLDLMHRRRGRGPPGL